tara:strand:+ start:983 stop:1771 length:789 start_codon:yes stop_codon:yes gene_type:complete
VIKAKKSLGQNFLVDENILKKIVDISEIQDRSILEIGPGTGNLTSFILKNKPKKLFVVEKDKDLVLGLRKKFKDFLVIINEDILDIDEKKFSKEKLIVFGNLPYNISTEILCKWILNLDNDEFWFECLILMFQKEVADRIIANVNTSNYGRLSILAKWKLDIVRICNIKPSCFFPKPKIESSLLLFKPKKNFFKIDNPKNIELVTRSFFNHRRKMIKKPFNQLFNGKSYIQKKLKLNLNLRPQNLSLDTYYNLIKEYEKLSG